MSKHREEGEVDLLLISVGLVLEGEENIHNPMKMFRKNWILHFK